MARVVVGSLPCSERFSPGTPVFPSPQKPTTLPNSNSIWNARTRLSEFIRTLNCFVGKKQFTIFFYNLQVRPREFQETQGDRIDVKFPIPHPLSSRKLRKSPILPSHPYIPTPTTFHFLPPTYLFCPDFSLLPSFSGQFSVHPILYLLSSSSARV